MKSKTRMLALLGVGVAIAMILSYIEFLLPPLVSAVPGIKLGLANVIIIFILYKLGVRAAFAVSIVRVCLSALLFGTVMTFAYSIAGALLSLFLMVLAKRFSWFSTVGVSIVGGVSHNLGQVLMAIILLNMREIGYYMAVLAVSGTVTGIFVGILAALMLRYIRKI